MIAPCESADCRVIAAALGILATGSSGSCSVPVAARQSGGMGLGTEQPSFKVLLACDSAVACLTRGVFTFA